VQDEAAEKIDGLEVEDFLFAAVSVVAPSQTDHTVAEAEQTVLRDGDAVGVAGEVVEDVSRAAEGLLGVDDPVVFAEIGGHAGSDSGVILFRATKDLEELAAEDARERADREEVAARAANPTPV
jgi:hypothetical protein